MMFSTTVPILRRFTPSIHENVAQDIVMADNGRTLFFLAELGPSYSYYGTQTTQQGYHPRCVPSLSLVRGMSTSEEAPEGWLEPFLTRHVFSDLHRANRTIRCSSK